MSVVDRRAQLAAVVERLLGEWTDADYGYDLAPALVPSEPLAVQTPAGPKMVPTNFVFGYVLMITTTSPLLSHPRMAAGFAVPDGWPDEEKLHQAVSACVQALRAGRQELLAEGNGAAPQIVRT